jgi:aryl-alcohol dehydrogenase-like predicted oxidoreductase
MQTRSYGSNGAQVSAIGLGGAFLTQQSFADGIATVHRALDLGVSYFDTSPMYGQGASQAVLGAALDGVKTPHLLATKLGYFSDPAHYHNPDALATQLGENLRLLRRSRVDTLQLHEADMHHWWSTNTDRNGRIDLDAQYDFAAAPALAFLRHCKAEGHCRFAGVSGNNTDAMTHIHRSIDVDTLLLAFNYDLIRRSARRVLPAIGTKGTTRMLGAIFQHGLARIQPELLQSPPAWMTPTLLARFKELHTLQKESGLSLAAMGVRYILQQKDIECVIIGAASPDEIAECVQAAQAGPLPADLYEQVEGLGVE